MTSATVVITREHRDALHHEIRSHCLPAPFDDVEMLLPRPGRGAEVRALWDDIVRAAGVLDAIGWDALSDEEAYTVALDADCIRWVRERLESTEHALEGYSETLAQADAGGDPWERQRRSDPSSLAVDVADLRYVVDRDLELVHACRSILAQVA